MLHNDFFLRCLSFEDGQAPSSLTLTCLAGGRPCLQIRYEGDELTRRLAYGREELARYRDSSLPRILGLSRRPETAFLHECPSSKDRQRRKKSLWSMCSSRTTE